MILIIEQGSDRRLFHEPGEDGPKPGISGPFVGLSLYRIKGSLKMSILRSAKNLGPEGITAQPLLKRIFRRFANKPVSHHDVCICKVLAPVPRFGIVKDNRQFAAMPGEILL